MGNVTSYTYGAGSTGNPLLANDLLTITDPNAQPGGPDAGDRPSTSTTPRPGHPADRPDGLQDHLHLLRQRHAGTA